LWRHRKETATIYRRVRRLAAGPVKPRLHSLRAEPRVRAATAGGAAAVVRAPRHRNRQYTRPALDEAWSVRGGCWVRAWQPRRARRLKVRGRAVSSGVTSARRSGEEATVKRLVGEAADGAACPRRWAAVEVGGEATAAAAAAVPASDGAATERARAADGGERDTSVRFAQAVITRLCIK
jgi:hypothetical protein